MDREGLKSWLADAARDLNAQFDEDDDSEYSYNAGKRDMCLEVLRRMGE